MSDDLEIASWVDVLQARLSPGGSLPRELTILGLPPEAGQCPSCGDPHPIDHSMRDDRDRLRVHLSATDDDVTRLVPGTEA